MSLLVEYIAKQGLAMVQVAAHDDVTDQVCILGYRS